MANELSNVAAWMFALLTADPDGVNGNGANYQGLNTLIGGRVYEFMAPESATYPLVVFTFLSGRDLMGTGGRRVFSRGVFHVKAYCEGNSFVPSGLIADRIDAILQQGETMDGTAVLGCVRERPLQGADEDEGVRHNMMGGEYSFWVSPIDAMAEQTIINVDGGTF